MLPQVWLERMACACYCSRLKEVILESRDFQDISLSRDVASHSKAYCPACFG